MTDVAKKKIAFADFGAKAIMSDAHKDKTHLILGVVGGIAVALAKGETPSGEAIEGLRGAFRFVPADKTADVLSAPVLWLPSGFDANIKAQLTAKENPASEVRFLYQLSVTKDADGKGYSVSMDTLLDVVPEVVAVDPVVQLFAEHLPEAETVSETAPDGSDVPVEPSVEGEAVKGRAKR